MVMKLQCYCSVTNVFQLVFWVIYIVRHVYYILNCQYIIEFCMEESKGKVLYLSYSTGNVCAVLYCNTPHAHVIRCLQGRRYLPKISFVAKVL